jgi:hypothetical protein
MNFFKTSYCNNYSTFAAAADARQWRPKLLLIRLR